MRKVTPAAATPSAKQRKLIDDLGGPVSVAKTIKQRTGQTLTPQAVSNWRSRGIPFAYRASLALEAAGRDIGVPKNFLNEGKLPPAPAPPSEEVPFL